MCLPTFFEIPLKNHVLRYYNVLQQYNDIIYNMEKIISLHNDNNS